MPDVSRAPHHEPRRPRAAAKGLNARLEEGDAESLPYGDGTFDIVASIYGAMFAPRPDWVAAELARVCRPGGTIAMGNWTREGIIGQTIKTVARHVPPPDMPPPVLWGDEPTVRARFNGALSSLRTRRVTYRFDYPFPPDQVVEFFRRNYGPTVRAFAELREAGQAALRSDLVDQWDAHNVSARSGRTVVDAEYLEVVGTRA